MIFDREEHTQNKVNQKNWLCWLISSSGLSEGNESDLSCVLIGGTTKLLCLEPLSALRKIMRADTTTKKRLEKVGH